MDTFTFEINFNRWSDEQVSQLISLFRATGEASTADLLSAYLMGKETEVLIQVNYPDGRVGWQTEYETRF